MSQRGKEICLGKFPRCTAEIDSYTSVPSWMYSTRAKLYERKHTDRRESFYGNRVSTPKPEYELPTSTTLSLVIESAGIHGLRLK